MRQGWAYRRGLSIHDALAAKWPRPGSEHCPRYALRIRGVQSSFDCCADMTLNRHAKLKKHGKSLLYIYIYIYLEDVWSKLGLTLV